MALGILLVIFLALSTPFIVAFIAAVWCECSEDHPTREQMREELKKEAYNKEILQNISAYEDLMGFLAENEDTILNYNDLRDKVIQEKRGDTLRVTTVYRQDCYHFSDDSPYSDYRFSNLPSFLKKDFTSLLERTKPTPSYFDLCRNNVIKLPLPVRTNKETYISLAHQLYWSRRNLDSLGNKAFFKDTLINANLRYTIIVRDDFNLIDPCNIAPN